MKERTWKLKYVEAFRKRGGQSTESNVEFLNKQVCPLLGEIHVEVQYM